MMGGVEGSARMEAVREADRDGLHRVILQEILPIPVAPRHAELLGTRVQRLLVEIRERHRFRALDLGQGAEVRPADTTTADDPEPNCF